MAQTYNEPKYKIDSPDFKCHACEGEVPCEAPYYSAVFYEAEDFRRRNYCTKCWGGKAPAPSGGAMMTAPSNGAVAFAFWRSRRPPLPTDRPKKIRFDQDLVLEFFRRLEGDETFGSAPAVVPEGPSPPAEAGSDGAPGATASPGPVPAGPSPEERNDLRFVLALLLLRKKVLNYVSSAQRDGSEWLKMGEKKEPGRHHWVRNPNLKDSQLEKLKDRIGELLNMQI